MLQGVALGYAQWAIYNTRVGPPAIPAIRARAIKGKQIETHAPSAKCWKAPIHELGKQA